MFAKSLIVGRALSHEYNLDCAKITNQSHVYYLECAFFTNQSHVYYLDQLFYSALKSKQYRKLFKCTVNALMGNPANFLQG